MWISHGPACFFLLLFIDLIVALYSKLRYEIIIVDDNSPDGTQEVVKRLQRVYGEDKIVRLFNTAR